MSIALVETREEIASIAKKQLDVNAEYEGKEMPADVFGESEQRLAQLKELKGKEARLLSQEQMASDVKALDEEYNRPAGRQQFPNQGPEVKARQDRRSTGELFLASDDYQSWLKSFAPNGHISEKKKFDSPAVGLKTITGASATSAGALVWPDIQPGVPMLGYRPLVMRDIVTIGQTGSDTVEYAREVAQTNNAAVVAEATASSGSSGSKPESNFTLEKVSEPVKTIAHFVTATSRALADAGQMRTLIDNFLRQGLAQALEDEMVTGDGTGEHFTGIANLSGTQSQAWSSNILQTTRKAKTIVRTVGRATPTAYLLNPTDWETIDLLQDNEARYYAGGPFNVMLPKLWGLPVVESEAVPVGTGYVGDFKTLVLWDRQQASISVSNSHSDYFTRNLVAILGEERHAFGALRPSAIVEMDLTA